jgi:serine/threonine protein phosphatase PrpC
VERTREQQHSFNCPFQLMCLPTADDFPRLLADGRYKLVKAVQNRKAGKEDLPEDAELYSLDVEEGDLLVLGTDGVFDNLRDSEICGLAASACRDQQAPSDELAKMIVEAACERSKDPQLTSPFSEYARKEGYAHSGGKLDDVTCVCAWLVGCQWRDP